MAACVSSRPVPPESVQAAECVANLLRKTDGAQNVIVRIDRRSDGSEVPVVAYSFHNRAGRLQRDIVPFVPGESGKYGYPISAISDGSPFGNPLDAEDHPDDARNLHNRAKTICSTFWYLVVGQQ
jgi:hypothetical protein